MNDHADTSVTVAFEVAGLQELNDPRAVFQETAAWAEHIGIVGDVPTHEITGFARAHGIDIGFHSGPRDLVPSLATIRQQPELAAERYVLISASTVDQEQVQALGWGVVSIESAAEAAGWAYGTDEEDDTRLDDSWI